MCRGGDAPAERARHERTSRAKGPNTCHLAQNLEGDVALFRRARLGVLERFSLKFCNSVLSIDSMVAFPKYG